MNRKLFCPHCGQHIAADSDIQGTSVNCPICDGEFIAPIFNAPSPTSEPEPPPTTSPPLSHEAPARLTFRDLWAPRATQAQPEPVSSAMPPPQPSAPQSFIVTAKGDITRFLSARKLFWFSISLWVVACGAVAFALRGATFKGNFNDKAVEKLIEAVGRVLIGAGVLAWTFRSASGRRRGYGFLMFSAVCAAAALYFASRFHAEVRHEKPLSQETSQRMVANLTEVAEQAASGGVPKMKPVGNATFDAALPAMNAFSQDFFGYLNRMEDEIDALHREGIFSASALAKESTIASEIRKRVESQNIIERYKKGLSPMIESARARFASLRVTEEVRRGALRGFEKAVSAQVPRLNEMFSLRLQREKVEADFLRFMLATFSDYRFAEKAISFKTPSNAQRYKELVQGIDDAGREATAYQKRQLEAVEGEKAQLQILAH